jgi:DNA polymerase-3 subunit alpha
VILYQEQVMSIASLLGGFTMGEADILRRAMGKKKPQEIMALREQFLAGAGRNGLDQATASALFDLMENFAGYGFNKSHSAAYALISYQTAYLKAHYPVEYMCAFLSSVIDHQERVVFYLKECRRLGISILPPDINESDENFTVSEGKIRFGLGAIKNVGETAVRAIIEARREGRFVSVMDFFRRVDPRHLNKRVLENLVLAGAFDGLGMSRRETLSVLEQCLALGAGMREAAASPQLTLFGAESVAVEDPAPAEPGEFPPAERLRREKEVLGFYVSGNPLAEYREVLPLYITHELGQVAELEDGARVHVAGIVSAVKKHRNKKGEAWASLVLEDFSAKVAAVVFPAVFRRQGACLQADGAVLAEARVMRGEEGVKLAIEGVAAVPAAVNALHVAVGEQLDADAGRERLLAVLARHRGAVPVYLRLPGRRVLKLDPSWWVRASVELKQELGEVCGPRNVWFA